MYLNKAIKKNKFQKIVFITITVLIAVGLVFPLAGLFQEQPAGNGLPDTEQTGQTALDDLPALEARAKENPRDTAVLMELGEAYIRAGKPDQAVKTYEQVLAVEPNNITVRLEMAYIYYFTSQYDLAIGQLNEIIKNNPDNGEAHLIYGYVLGQGKKDYAAGIQELEKFIALAKQGTDVEHAKQAIEEWKALAAQEQ
ncbi:tetratricopeptide repeat protein [Pelotomaculum terephthalicicum JT]|uniref:tetratricopeptide repeat protein n=1 Tax=Pelotomaculum TaxID=191373 RepID=UPI0009D317F1|nr:MULTISPECIES: tetratricopeptide repeat protein [Pelotomaculum]MCG9968340.1 tetratricopeptide repeat protein [Pelotomaculum terephthalicicum JT]OPX87550.1 MAG: Outer membrane protein assembly factor BamD [Pelotomaculum sp. PtaB.Bin117]OPY60790.1 MAG: Outer membrane protein assembly factor BamD [Pelotomaculum sp. PtaU1.Bin065]